MVSDTCGDDSGQQDHADVERLFVLGVEALGLRVTEDERGIRSIVRPPPQTPAAPLPQGPPPPPLPPALGEVVGRRYAAPGTSNAPPDVEILAPDSPLFQWLWGRLAERPDPLHAAPVAQPVSVHELTPALFAPYRVDGGHAHLAGCQLQDRPLLRLTCQTPATDKTPATLTHCLANADGNPLDPELIDRLELHDLKPLNSRLSRLDRALLERWVEIARRACRRPHAPPQQGECLLTTVVWCKFAQGKLAFTIGDSSVELEFADWAHLLCQGTAQPPKYTCPWTGQQSYHLAATDDGRITVAEAIEACEASGQRVVQTELETCDVTGQRVVAGQLRTCPVSGERALARLFEPCRMCGQQVSPHALSGGRCLACRNLRSASRESPPLARLLNEFPGLGSGRRWRAAESDDAYVLVGTSLWNRILVVVDKRSGHVQRVARGTLFGQRWQEVPASEREQWKQTSHQS